MQLRKAFTKDIAAIQDLLRQAGRKSDVRSIEAQLMSNEMPDILLYDVGNSAVGLVEIYVLPVFGEPKPLAMVTCLVITEALRYSGIGSEITGSLLAWARARDCRRLNFNGLELPGEALFFQTLGFRSTNGNWIKEL